MILVHLGILLNLKNSRFGVLVVQDWCSYRSVRLKIYEELITFRVTQTVGKHIRSPPYLSYNLAPMQGSLQSQTILIAGHNKGYSKGRIARARMYAISLFFMKLFYSFEPQFSSGLKSVLNKGFWGARLKYFTLPQNHKIVLQEVCLAYFESLRQLMHSNADTLHMKALQEPCIAICPFQTSMRTFLLAEPSPGAVCNHTLPKWSQNFPHMQNVRYIKLQGSAAKIAAD